MLYKYIFYFIILFLPLIIGYAGSSLSVSDSQVYEIQQPLLAPITPMFEFGWTSVYILMGLASVVVTSSNADRELKNRALQVFYFQLGINFCWTFFFYVIGIQLFAFFWIAFLWVCILIALILFYRISKIAFTLFVPYFAWFSYLSFRNFELYLVS